MLIFWRLCFFLKRSTLFVLILKFHFCFLKFSALKSLILFVIFFRTFPKFLLIFSRFIACFFLCNGHVLFLVFFLFWQLLQSVNFSIAVPIYIANPKIFSKIFHCIKFFVSVLRSIVLFVILVPTQYCEELLNFQSHIFVIKNPKIFRSPKFFLLVIEI